MEPETDCYSCKGNADIDRLPLRERIAVDEFWRVAHAFDSALPGWLVLLPRRHVTAIAELTDGEAASLGQWVVRLSRALHAVTGCMKTYVAQFAEAEGFAHVHFHIVPRPADLVPEHRGPRVFGLLGANDRPQVSDAVIEELATDLSAQLTASR
ncbi:MAG: HIT family protein [Streptosporangiaceae bacterium]